MHPSHPKSLLTRLKTVSVTCVVTMLFAGCAVTPDALDSNEIAERVRADQERIYSDQEPVYKPISFNEALARALKYNLDYRLKLMESALNSGMLDVARYDMLPNLLTSAGYTFRDNVTASRSFNIVDGEPVEPPGPPSYSGGVEKQRQLAGAEFSWSILDFGVGYYRAKQQANEVMIAEERRRKIAQDILRQTRSAYWRAVGAQRVSRNTERLLRRAKSALSRSRTAEKKGLIPAKEALSYQRIMLDAVTLLTARLQQLEIAKRELTALMNLTPGTEYSVVEIAEKKLYPAPVNVAELEEIALYNRPELRQEDYEKRISADEARVQLLYLLPNLGLNLSSNYDSNKYLYNNNWLEVSSQLTFNLTKAFAIPATRRAGEAQLQVDDFRRMALSMAILTQTRVSIERYHIALRNYDLAKQSNWIDQRMVKYTKAAEESNLETELELIRAETRELNSRYGRYYAYASAQDAFGTIYSSLGLDVVPSNVENLSLGQLGFEIEKYITTIEKETFQTFVNTNKKKSVKRTAPKTQAAAKPASKAKPAAVAASTTTPAGQPARSEAVSMSKTDPTFSISLEQSEIVKTLSESAGTSANLDASTNSSIVNAATMALQNDQRKISSTGKADYTLKMKLLMQMPENGTRRGMWKLALVDRNGKRHGLRSFIKTLAAEPDSQSLADFANASVSSNARLIGQIIQ